MLVRSLPLQDGKEEVAVKAVSKSYFKQDPKVRENLEREIRIMKLLKTCDYVVRLCHVQVRALQSMGCAAFIQCQAGHTLCVA